MRRKIALTLVTAALAASFSAAPASANHTLCDNEPAPGDQWFPIGTGGQGAGFEINGDQNYVCVYHGLSSGGVLIVIRPDGSQTVCPYYTTTNPDDDLCYVIP